MTQIVTFIARKFVLRQVVTFEMICEFVNIDLNIESVPDTLRKILHEHNVFRSVEVKVEEEGRVLISPATLKAFFDTLEVTILDVPAPLIINADEVGFQEFIDFKNVRSCVPYSCTAEDLELPMKRSSKRSTSLIGISLSGSILKPLIILKRKTFFLVMYLLENG